MAPPRKKYKASHTVSEDTSEIDENELHDDKQANKGGPASLQAKDFHKRDATVAAVIGTTELFEQILVNLDFTTLLLSQRVSRRFRDIIASNIDLQKKLFLVPATIEEVWALGMIDEESLLCTSCKWRDLSAETMILNTHILKCSNPIPDDGDEDREIRTTDELLPYTISARKGQSSWERMYVSQPPSKFVEIYQNMFERQSLIQVDKNKQVINDALDDQFSISSGDCIPVRELMDDFEEGFMDTWACVTIWNLPLFDLGCEVIWYEDWVKEQAVAERDREDEVED